MSGSWHNFVLFLGHLHPVLVHLPIGALVLLGVLELAARFSRFQDAARNRCGILGLAAGAALLTAAAGWMLARAGGYDGQLLRWHRWAGVSLALVCAVTFVVCLTGRSRSYRLLLVLTLMLLVVAGHLGASITHGSDFLTRYAPIPGRAIVPPGTRSGANRGPASAQTQWPVYAELIEPILQRRCTTCHGPDKHKANLRLDSFEGLRRGGKGGAVFVAGNPGASRLIQRLVLPLDDDDHMPPAGKPQPTAEEIELLAFWISAGAPAKLPAGGFQAQAAMQSEFAPRRP